MVSVSDIEASPGRTAAVGVSHPVLTARHSIPVRPAPSAAKLLSSLFSAASRSSGAAASSKDDPHFAQETERDKPKPRGYAALATATLKALCRARGLPTTGEREELLQQISSLSEPMPSKAQVAAKRRPATPQRVSQRLQERPRTVAPRTAGARAVAQSDEQQASKNATVGGCGEEAKPAGHKAAPAKDAVSRVLQEAARLAKEVAEVQRQFRERQKASEARGSAADALLDDIAAAGVKRSRGG